MDVVIYKTTDGTKVALVEPGRKLMKVLLMDGKLRVRKIPMAESRYMTPAKRKGEPYPVRRAVARFRGYGKAFGMTKTARTFLSGS